jgi:hypothetical protein
MMFKNNRFSGLAALTAVALMSYTSVVSARENIASTNHLHRDANSQLKTSAAQCQPATSSKDLQINNVRARLMTGGDMWWNLGTQVAEYEVPKGSGKSSQFAASCWIGGFDAQGQLKVAAQTYRQDGNDYWPGILDKNAAITQQTCQDWDRFWLVDKSNINNFIQAYKSSGQINPSDENYVNILQWPGTGNTFTSNSGATIQVPTDKGYAPFIDVNHDGIYQPLQGEYPDIKGDEMIWWVFNDAGNAKLQSQTAAMGIEVQTSAFAYSSQDFLNDATFCNYRVINRGQLTIDSTYIAVWDDCDLGYAFDDFIGCDTTRGLGIQYNGTTDDGATGGHPVNSYGTDVPQVGLDFFQGPKKTVNGVTKVLPMTNFTYYNNDFSSIGNPRNGTQIYNYMTGSILDGTRFSDDFKGPGIQSVGYGNGPISHFIFWGDPGDNSQWSECSCNNNPGDRRFVFSSGPFVLLPGVTNDITFGCIWAPGVGGCPKTNFKTITSIDDNAQALFDAGFKTLEGPEAPNLIVRELDNRLIFYIENPYGSNNYKEQYGNYPAPYNTQADVDSAAIYNEVSIKAAKIVKSKDSLYRFQGYRVFQLANSSVSAADIFDPTTGEINTDKASEVFQCDIHDSIARIINYTKNTTISDTTWIPQIKINSAKDSGIRHTFELTQDQFATGANKTLVNYKNYYYVAVAYAYNDFSYNKVTKKGGFDPKNDGTTQDMPYLGSSHGPNGTPIQVISAMPNPANGDMGTVLNSDYNTGVVIHRIEGVGNGGNDVKLDSTTEAAIVANGSVGEAVYDTGFGPVNVRVVDPVKVQSLDWTLLIKGPAATFGIDSSKGSWELRSSNGDVIVSEDHLNIANEQILSQFGLSVNIQQVLPPGADQTNGNGYLTSEVVFDDATKPWLAGVQDQSDSNIYNWIRSGNNTSYSWPNANSPCNFRDYKLDTNLFYENMFSNFTPVKSTWAPYELGASFYSNYNGTGTYCGFTVAAYPPLDPTSKSVGYSMLNTLPGVDLVFTSDKSKWTRVLVVEAQEDSSLAEGHARKFFKRKHLGWNGTLDAAGNPVYSTDPTDSAMSWFPGYAINVETGVRLNIVFGEDSWQRSQNGADMIWNPTSVITNEWDGSIVFGGKHLTYVLSSAYDSDKVISRYIDSALYHYSNTAQIKTYMQKAYTQFAWAGVPTLAVGSSLLPLSQGLIPTQTKLRFRVDRPYAAYTAVNSSDALAVNGNNPLYKFTTKGLAPTPASDASVDKKGLLDKIYAVPNPYYGYSGYEQNRFDTKVRIINLPAKVTINIYALDGSLIRTLTKSDASTSYIDWDIRNIAGLPVASGMYLMDVKAEGIGETVVKWFGAMRPIDITTY